MSERVFTKSYTYTTAGSGSETCDPPCSEANSEFPCGQECVDGGCVSIRRIPCTICPMGDGQNLDTHYWDITESVCLNSANQCCPVVPRVEGIPRPDRVINVPKNTTQFCRFYGNETSLTKTGEGKLVINERRPDTLGTIVCNGGTIIVASNEVFDDRSSGMPLPPPSPSEGWGNNPPGRPFVCGTIGTSTPTFNPPTIVISPKDNCNPLCVCTFGGLSLRGQNIQPDVNNYSYLSNELPEISGKLIISGSTQLVIKDGTYDKNEIRSYLSAGRNDGGWDGTVGITTDYSINDTKCLGYNINEVADCVVQFALPGDTNLDGVVDILDVSNIVASGKYNTESTNAEWIDGDFNYDGMVDILDVSLFLSEGLYDTGSYLPQNTSFKISWSPLLQSARSIDNQSLTVSTTDLTESLPYNIYGNTFQIKGQTYTTVGELSNSLDCHLKGGVFNVNAANPHDGACFGPATSARSGACCFSDINRCATIYDDLDSNGSIIKSASYKCATAGRGFWLGYNTSCEECVFHAGLPSNSKEFTT